MPRTKKWMRWGDELYYSGPGEGEVYHIIDTGDVEIHLDKEGEIIQIIVRSPDKYLERDEIEEIATIYDPEELEREIRELKKRRPIKNITP